MKRRWYTVSGITGVSIAIVAAALFPRLISDVPAFALWVVTFLVSGVLAVLGGEGRTVAGLGWRQLIGLSYVVFALGLASLQFRTIVTHRGDAAMLATAAGIAVGALVLLFVGLDLLRDAEHFDLSRLEPGPIFGSRDE